MFQLFIHFGCQYRIDKVLQLTEDGDGSVQLELSSVIINTLQLEYPILLVMFFPKYERVDIFFLI